MGKRQLGESTSRRGGNGSEPLKRISRPKAANPGTQRGEQIILMGRHPDRIALARAFGGTNIVTERAEEAIARISDLSGGLGAHAVL
jgi:hypothetical protein